MGTNNSKQINEFNYTDLYNKIDQIATQYILTMDFKSLQRLNEKEYCNKLVLIASDIFDKKLSSLEVKYMLQRTQYGTQSKDDMLLNEMKKEKFYYFMGDDRLLLKQDVTLNGKEMKSDERTRVCIGIARFYILIAHIFASIVKTLNPVYSYKDDDGQVVELDFFNQHKLPTDKKVTVKRMNFCEKRLTSLLDNIGEDENSQLFLQSKSCKADKNSGMLSDEPGMFEFRQLYLDENYDYFTGRFTSMSAESNAVYMRDLKQIYTAFTGKEEMPDHIQQFSDIQMEELDCLSESSEKRVYKTDSNSELFLEYARNIKSMISATKKNQSQLLEVLHLLFIPSKEDPSIITLNPDITEEMLTATVVKTRNTILNIYTDCEKHYVIGLQIYQSIVENVSNVNLKTQFSELKNQIQKFANIEIEKWKK